MDAPHVEDLPAGRSFKIGEVSRLVGVQPHVLRFWEQSFGRLRPRKLSNGHRRYSRADVLLLRRIRALLHGRGLTIAGARRLLQEGDAAVLAVLSARGAEGVWAPPSAASADRACEALRLEVRRLKAVTERAREEAAYWRVAAREAERGWDHLHRALRTRLVELGQFSNGVDTQ